MPRILITIKYKELLIFFFFSNSFFLIPETPLKSKMAKRTLTTFQITTTSTTTQFFCNDYIIKFCL